MAKLLIIYIDVPSFKWRMSSGPGDEGTETQLEYSNY